MNTPESTAPNPPASGAPVLVPSVFSLRLVAGLMAGILIETAASPTLALAGFAGWAMVALLGQTLVARLQPVGFALLLMLPLALAGYALAAFSGEASQRLHPAGMIEAEGSVAMAEAMTKSRQRIRFTPDAPAVPGDWRLIIPKGEAEVIPGDRIRITVRLQHPLPQLLPGGFDFTAHALRKGYSATGFIRTMEVIGTGRAGLIAGLRYRIQQRLLAALPDDRGAVASALLVGLRGRISPDLRESFRASGLAHLLAISGLHMVLFCGSVLFALRLMLAVFPVFSSRYPALKIAALAALPFGFFYLLIAGMPVSAVRAFGMVSFVILAVLFDRRGMTLHHVAMMALLILVIDPRSLFDPAFQMSFAAVFALVAGWMIRQRHHLLHGRNTTPGAGRRLLRYLGGIAVASVLASTASAPFVLYHFGVTTAWSVLANLAGMPLMGGVVMPAGVIALVLMPVGLDGVAFGVMGQGIALLVRVAETIAVMPFSSISLPPPPGIALVLLALAMTAPFMVVMARRGMLAIPPLIIALGLWVMEPRPVLAAAIIHNRIHAVVVTETGHAVISRRQVNAFTRSVLLRPFGLAEASYIAEDQAADCGRGYCLVRAKGGAMVAVVWRRPAMTDACRQAELVIAHIEALYPCASGAMLIDRARLRQDGGTFGLYGSGEFRLRGVNTGG